MPHIYEFYGWERAIVPPISEQYQAVSNPRVLYDLLSDIWCAETCGPRMRHHWNTANKTLGQCSCTAYLAQDIFGGKVYGMPLHAGGYHCYNDVNGYVFDLTSEQFGGEPLSYEGNPEMSREIQFADDERLWRYNYMRRELHRKLGIPR